jgi:Zn-dependent peptidase ImmA (M78 family)/transcriptional regulator with XRE-family HTH domain
MVETMATMDKAQRLLWKFESSNESAVLSERFNPSRLALARKRKGLTKIALAALIEVDRKSVQSYETGQHSPSLETMRKIESALGFPREFFLGDDLDEPTLDSGSFRSMSKMTAPQRDMALSQAAIGLHFSAWLEKYFDLPSDEIPNLGREHSPEAAAESVRREWSLGSMSIRNMVHLLEAKGVRVFSLAVDAREVDAFSMWKGKTPFAFLNTNKTPEHSRFDAAHELGHLALHRHGPPQGIEAEKQANAFASAFLMPRGSVLANVPKFISYTELVKIKTIWGTSVGALAHRMHAMGLMSDWQYRGICIEIAKRGRDIEPNSVPRESSQILPKVLGSLQADGINRSKIAAELAIPRSEIEYLLSGLTWSRVEGGAVMRRGA